MLRKSDFRYAFAVGIVIAGIVYMVHTKNGILIF